MHRVRTLVRRVTGSPDGVITCRRCETVFPAAEGSCPACGTPVRGMLPPAVAILAGAAALLSSLFPFDVVPALLGIALLWFGIHVVRDRRERVRDAAGRRESGRLRARGTRRR